MSDETTPTPPAPTGDAISSFIAHQANDAIAKGADPKTVTAKLGQMVAYLHANPDTHTQANEALGKFGADPLSVATKLSKMSSGMNYSGQQEPAGVVPSALRGATFGLSDKLIAGGEAAIDAVKAGAHGGDVGSTLKDSYLQNLNARRGSADQYSAEHPAMDIASDMAGSVLPMAYTGGLSAAPEAIEATRLAKMGKAITTGAKFGAANAAGRSDAIEQGRGVEGLAADAAKGLGLGAAGGALSIPAGAVAGKLLQWSGAPKAIASVAGSVGKILPPGRLQNAATSLSQSLGEDGLPSQAIARSAAMDAKGGFAPEPMHPSVPPMALDEAGPNVQGAAERIANDRGPGRATIIQAVGDRAKQMRPAITQQLEEGTGVKSSDRLGPLQKAVDDRTAEAKTNYDAARAETQGQSVASPTLEQIKATKTGGMVYTAAMNRQGNIFRSAEDPKAIPPMPKGFGNPEQWAETVALAKARGIPIPGVASSEPVPDPETLHLMKEHLTKLAKLNKPDEPMTAEAVGLLPLIDKVKSELPPIWQRSDAAYAARSRIIEMMDRGRKVFQTPINPPASAKKALTTSLGGLDQRIAVAAPEEQQAAQVGAATAAHARLLRAPNSMKSPGTIMATNPEQVEQLGHAFPTPAKAADFQHAVASWDRVQAQANDMLGNSRTNLRKNLDERDLVQPGAVAARSPRMVVRNIINGLNREYETGQNQQIDSRIAKILTSPDRSALAAATKTGASRAALLQAAGLQDAAAGADALTRGHGGKKTLR